MSKQKNYTVQDLEKMVGKHGGATTAPAPMTVVTVHEVPPRPPKAKKSAKAPKKDATKWTYEGYWNAVLGTGTPGRVVGEFDLAGGTKRQIDEWLGTAESEAWAIGGRGGRIPKEWRAFHSRALDSLIEAAAPEAPKKAAAKKAPKKAAAKKAPKKAAAKKAPKKAAAKKAPKKAAAKKAPKKAAAKKAPKKAPKKAAAKKAPKKAAAKKAPKLVGARVVSKVDGDTGRVISVQGHRALVGWDQGVQTHTDVRDLRVV